MHNRLYETTDACKHTLLARRSFSLNCRVFAIAMYNYELEILGVVITAGMLCGFQW